MTDVAPEPAEPPIVPLTQHLIEANTSLDRAHGMIDAFEDKLFGAKPRPSTGSLGSAPPTQTLAEYIRKSADSLSERLAALTTKL